MPAVPEKLACSAKQLFKCVYFIRDSKSQVIIDVELVLSIPAQSTVRISIGFEHSILKWHEYPPDANKGFYIGSALVSALIPTEDGNSTLGKHIN